MLDETKSQPEQGPAGGREGDVDARLAAYRNVREQLERSILPLATSVDGYRFRFQASLYDLELRRGGYVVIEGDGIRRLGQITDLTVESSTASGEGILGRGTQVVIQVAMGSGVVLDDGTRAFHAGSVRPAEPAEVDAWLGSTRPDRAALTIGELVMAPGVPAVLDSGGFNRHTFMCGQSGSGKTYSLGVLIERILAQTSLRVVILDPNSDYVGLPRVRSGADPYLADRYAEVPPGIAVWSNDPAAEHPLRLRFADLEPAARAAVLGLDPVRDREEYAVLVDLLRMQRAGEPLVTDASQLLEAETTGARQLGLRAVSLGVLGWSIWSPTARSLVEELRNPTARCTVVDLGSLDTMEEQRVVAEAVLSTLWDNRAAREPCLVVIDEAHNICPAEPADPVSRLSSDRAVQIAAEGRKFGLYLLTSTQRPHKVHENVVSQCDNLLLMRMNSEADVAELSRLLSFVPPGLMAGSVSFRMGQALVAGRVMPQAAYVQMGERVTEEGGADIPTTWALPGR